MPKPPKNAPAVEQAVEYFICDPKAVSIAGKKLQVNQKTISLKPSQASFYIASGAISTEDPSTIKNAEDPPPPPSGDAGAGNVEHSQG